MSYLSLVILFYLYEDDSLHTSSSKQVDLLSRWFIHTDAFSMGWWVSEESQQSLWSKFFYLCLICLWNARKMYLSSAETAPFSYYHDVKTHKHTPAQAHSCVLYLLGLQPAFYALINDLSFWEHLGFFLRQQFKTVLLLPPLRSCFFILVSSSPHSHSPTLSCGCRNQGGLLPLPGYGRKKEVPGLILSNHQRGEIPQLLWVWFVILGLSFD